MPPDVRVSGGKIKSPVGDAPVVPVVLLAVGGYLLWFGVHYFKRDVTWPTDPIKAVLTGKPLPATGAAAMSTSATLAADVKALQPDGGSSGAAASSGGSGGGSATGSAIADDALKYKGAGYVWGGNASKVGQWDCSSFVSYVLGHDLSKPLPGGHWGDPGFPPGSHGPTTIQYLVYGSALNRSQVGAGDLVVYNTHIGIATSNSEMISARSPSNGTGTDTIDGMTSSLAETAHYRRVG